MNTQIIEHSYIIATKSQLIATTNDKYFLGVSTNQLVVISPDKKRILEVIVDGTDNDAFLCSCNDLDNFLDNINLLKADIIARRNPIYRLSF